MLMCVAVGLQGSALNGMYHAFFFPSAQSLDANSVVNLSHTCVKFSVACVLSIEIPERVFS